MSFSDSLLKTSVIKNFLVHESQAKQTHYSSLNPTLSPSFSFERLTAKINNIIFNFCELKEWSSLRQVKRFLAQVPLNLTRKVEISSPLLLLTQAALEKNRFSCVNLTPSIQSLDQAIKAHFFKIWGIWVQEAKVKSVSFHEWADDLYDYDFERLVKGFTYLRQINLSQCNNLTSTSFYTLSLTCPHLLAIDLSFCRQIRTNDIQTLTQRCTKLRAIYLNHCKQTEDSFIQIIAENCPNLKSIHLNHCERITNISLQLLARHCPGLAVILLARCKRITDLAILSLASHCPQLSYLDLTDCKQINNHSIQALAPQMPHLISINLTGCNRITDHALQALAINCDQLRNILCLYCPKINDKYIQSLSAVYKSLVIIKDI